MPRLPAPETLQTRVFDTSTDVFAFGVLLLEMVGYGSLPNQVPSSRPDAVPKLLWSKLIKRCLDPVASERLSVNEALGVVEGWLTGTAAGSGSMVEGIIPLPTDSELDAGTLSDMVCAGAPHDVLGTRELNLSGLNERSQWESLSKIVEMSKELRAVRLERCRIRSDDVDPICEMLHRSTASRSDVIESISIVSLDVANLVGSPKEVDLALSSDIVRLI